jgi:hypothetical protein
MVVEERLHDDEIADRMGVTRQAIQRFRSQKLGVTNHQNKNHMRGRLSPIQPHMALVRAMAAKACSDMEIATALRELGVQVTAVQVASFRRQKPGPGDRFQIVAPKGALDHTYAGKKFVCRKVIRQKIKGYDASLDLGELVVFVGAIDNWGREVLHALPLEWCVKLPDPQDACQDRDGAMKD